LKDAGEKIPDASPVIRFLGFLGSRLDFFKDEKIALQVFSEADLLFRMGRLSEREIDIFYAEGEEDRDKEEAQELVFRGDNERKKGNIYEKRGQEKYFQRGLPEPGGKEKTRNEGKAVESKK
jgi:hypothetical protein